MEYTTCINRYTSMYTKQKQNIIRGYCYFVIGAMTVFLGGLIISINLVNNPIIGNAQSQNMNTSIDLDGDGIPNEIEQDCDPDICDIDNDGRENFEDSDSDNDGLLDSLEKGSTCSMITNCQPLDSDGDGLPDYLQSSYSVLPRSGANELFFLVIFIIVGLTSFVLYSESRANKMKIK